MIDRYDRSDVLINKAGSAIKVGNITSRSIETIEKVIKLNPNSVIHGLRAFVRKRKTKLVDKNG